MSWTWIYDQIRWLYYFGENFDHSESLHRHSNDQSYNTKTRWSHTESGRLLEWRDEHICDKRYVHFLMSTFWRVLVKDDPSHSKPRRAWFNYNLLSIDRSSNCSFIASTPTPIPNKRSDIRSKYSFNAFTLIREHSQPFKQLGMLPRQQFRVSWLKTISFMGILQ